MTDNKKIFYSGGDFTLYLYLEAIEGFPGCKDFYIWVHPVIQNGSIVNIKTVYDDSGNSHPNDREPKSRLTVTVNHPINGVSDVEETLDIYGETKEKILAIIQANFTVTDLVNTVNNHRDQRMAGLKHQIEQSKKGIKLLEDAAKHKIERMFSNAGI